MDDRVQTRITDRDLPEWVIGLGQNPQSRIRPNGNHFVSSFNQVLEYDGTTGAFL
jgi:hypothetical protein